MSASWRGMALWLVLLAAALNFCSGQAKSAGDVADERPQVLYLHTEFLPYKQDNDKDYSNRLGREIVRQAVLVAARDGLGLQTCDETLQETPPIGVSVVDLLVTERSHADGKWHVQLRPFVEGEDTSTAKPLWEKTYDFSPVPAAIYAEMIPKLEADSRGAIVEALKGAGLRLAAREKKSEKAAEPGEGVEELLLRPDFVGQFGAVRAAHQAVAAQGESAEWISVLARGYANLATLTHHQWTSATEVFAARAWLYAQRMVASDEKSAFALWNRAYAWGLGGCFQNALADVAKIESLGDLAEKDASAESREWTKLVKPYAKSDRKETKQVGADVHELKPWATYLYFQLANFARYPEWMYEAAKEVGPVCPMAYGVFDDLAHHGQLLGVIRMGAGAAPRAYDHFLPLTLADIPGLPDEIREVLPSDETKAAALRALIADPNPEDEFSGVPGFFAEKLREHSRTHATGDLSWSALASMLEEEEFVEVAMHMKVSMAGTEVSHEVEVNSLLPLVKNHRFANYIDSFRLGRVRDPAKLGLLFGQLQVRDPRMNMYWMFWEIGLLKDASGQPVGSALVNSAGRDFTLPDFVEYMFPAGPGAVNKGESETKSLGEEVLKIAPGTPIGTRILAQVTPSASDEQLATWEEEANDDSITLFTIAQYHARQGQEDAAVRCWQKAIEALPSSGEATIQLASYYRTHDDLKNWEKTLVDYLQTEDLGLQHSVVEQQLALGLAFQGEWKKAKPYALSSAQTYSCDGLRIGSHITEGLADWKMSEQLMAAASTNYPSSTGAEWYVWCRRNGRGDVKSAELLAAKFFALPQPHPTETSWSDLGQYKLLQGDARAARDAFQQVLSLRRTFGHTCLVAQLSREINDDAARTEAISAMENVAANGGGSNPLTPEVKKAGLLLLDMVKNGNLSAERLMVLDEALRAVDKTRHNSTIGWSYFIGNELEAAGREKDAEKYWRRVLVDPGHPAIYATLSGAKLAKYNGTARPDDDALTSDDLWPSKAK
jgi:tetratricopeptide (TPR) repeat protein